MYVHTSGKILLVIIFIFKGTYFSKEENEWFIIEFSGRRYIISNSNCIQLLLYFLYTNCIFCRWVRLHIPLFNPTHETLELEIANSNPSNFSTETDPKHPVSRLEKISEKIFVLSQK